MTALGTSNYYITTFEAGNRSGEAELVGNIFLIIFFGDRVMILLNFKDFNFGR